MFPGMLYFIARGWGVQDARRQTFYIATIFITAIAFVNYLATISITAIAFVNYLAMALLWWY